MESGDAGLGTGWLGQVGLEDTKLRWLIRLRWVVLGLTLTVTALARFTFGVSLPLVPILAVLTVMVLFNGYSLVRVKRGGALLGWELPAQLLFDLLAFTALFYFGGGADNPFMPMFVLPVAMAAILIPGRSVWWFALLAIGCFGFIMVAGTDTGVSGFALDLRMAGVWACFALSAALISYFVLGASQALRRTEQLLAETREQGLRNAHLAELGTLATGTAHELGTPLSTMAVVLGDLVKQDNANTELHTDLVLLRDQVYRCKDILSQLTCATGVMRAEAGTATPAGVYLHDLLDEWQRRRPRVTLTCTWRSEAPGPRILTEQTLSQALLNLVDNAADASPMDVTVIASWSESTLELSILDRGPGVPADVLDQLGKQPVSRKPGGVGVGFLLAHATISRLGGRLSVIPRPGGGTCCRVALPLEKIRTESEEP